MRRDWPEVYRAPGGFYLALVMLNEVFPARLLLSTPSNRGCSQACTCHLWVAALAKTLQQGRLSKKADDGFCGIQTPEHLSHPGPFSETQVSLLCLVLEHHTSFYKYFCIRYGTIFNAVFVLRGFDRD